MSTAEVVVSWEVLAPELEKTCNDSLVSNRSPYLANILELIKDKKLSDSDLARVSVVLLKTFTIYQDYKSKKLVISIFLEILQLQPAFLEKYIHFISEQVIKKPGTKAVSDYLNILEWIDAFWKYASKDITIFEENAVKLLQSQICTSAAIEISIDNHEHSRKTLEKQNQHRRRIRHSVLQSNIKTFVSVFRNNKDTAEHYMNFICKTVLEDYTKLSLPVSGILIILGSLTQSTLQLFSQQPVLNNILRVNYSEKACVFVGKEVILGKNPPSTYCLATGLSPFINEFVTLDLFKKHFIPNLEKANLRAPELAFSMSTEFYHAINASKIDLIEIYSSSKLMSQSFTSLKSTKEVVRNASLNSVIMLLNSCDPKNTDLKCLSKFVDEIFKNIKSNLNADYKTNASKILVNVPIIDNDLSKKLVNNLSAYVSKESNEIALDAMLLAFFKHYFLLNEQIENINKVISDGLKEKKPVLKKIWNQCFLECSEYATTDILCTFSAECLDFIKDTLSHHPKTNQRANLSSFQFINRINVLKIEQIQKAIGLIFESLPSTTLGVSFLELTLSTVLSSEERLLAVQLLKQLFSIYPSIIGFSIISSLEEKINTIIEDTTENTTSYSYISSVFDAISQPLENKEILSKILIRNLIVAQSKFFRLKNGWASLALSAGLDPFNIIKDHSTELVERISSIMLDKNMTKTEIYYCASKAASYATFINPTVMAPLITDLINRDLNTEELFHITAEDLQIWSGLEGELVINVLDKDIAKKLSDKNRKDYETLKWEQSIRKEQAKKNVKKLSKEEQILVNAQLEKESQIRTRITKLQLSLFRSINIIDILSNDATLASNGAEIWYPVAVNALLKLTQTSNSFHLIDTQAIDTFLNLSKNMSSRLEKTRFFIGLATLRVHNVNHIPDNFTQEPISELLTRILFKVKFIADRKPLDALSLTYLLPLLIVVLEEGKKAAISNADKPISRSDFVEEDKNEEHLMLAMEIVAVHAEVFEDPSIPRVPILTVLFSLLALPSQAKMAKECFNSLSQSISTAPTSEDLTVILSSILSPNPFVRATILEAIDGEFELEPFMNFSPEIYICRFDSEESNRETANFIWDFSKFEITDELPSNLLNFFKQSDSGLRLFAARAFAASVLHLKETNLHALDSYLKLLISFYKEKAQPLEDMLDEYGLVITTAAEREDPWEARSTIAIALRELSDVFTEEGDTIISVIRFLIEDGALGDRNLLVRQEMKEAGVEIITEHGAKKVEELIPVFEESLTAYQDAAIKENVIILYGSLATHLPKGDARITTIVERLLNTLDTPSSDVQQAVSQCLSPLVKMFSKDVESYINTLMDKLLNPTIPKSIRKGAAWGIAGLVQGYGISALSDFDIIRNLIEAAEDKKEAIRRESVAYAFEYLSKSLGKFFEPYVIEVLPNILKNLGDSVPDVRHATAEATKAIMAHTTSFGIKKLIPVAVSNLDEISWRTKRGSVELLGNMAYLDPTQLSNSLATIIPEIVGVLNDSHKEVRKSADESLKRFGEVIRNPEIQKLVPALIKAIGDPTNYTEEALDSLIQTQFVHYIDGPSLALIIHVIHRGMHERSANTKRKACKIVGNMAILVDSKDLIPYLQQLIDEVEIAMVDPVPSTRATAARALGALVERLGEAQFPDLIPSLFATLEDDNRSGDRLGSAQALAEVISGLGVSKLEELLPSILSGVTNFRAYVREGFMPLLLFLPVCFGTQFAPYINQTIQPILAGLADTDESIRETALKAGKLIVRNYATKAIDLLLPELEQGMFNENERIRLSSVQLTGDLLFQVTGISSKNEFDEESEYSGEVTKKMVEILGQERRDKILAALFVCRNDTSGIVRANTVDIWKALVPNTPRTIKEILPTLTGMIVSKLGSTSVTLRNIAAQTLGDLVRRVGSNAMSQLLPTLEENVNSSDDSNSRQGICIALTALIEPSSAESLEQYQSIIVNIIRTTLIDGSEAVRQSAASVFDVYQNVVGKVAVDEILPYLLNILKSSENSENALLGLQEIMATKSEVIFPILIPTLLTQPIDGFRASALGSLAEVAGSALYRRLSTIINSLVDSLIIKDISTENRESLEQSFDKVLLSVNDNEGLHPLLQQIMSLLKSENLEKRVVILNRLPNFFEYTTLDYDIYTPDLVSREIPSLDHEDPTIVNGAFKTLSVLIKKQDKSMLEKLVIPTKQALHLTGKEGTDIAAFALPRGPGCILPIFLHGLLYGSNDEREASALAIADIVSKTPAANLKPFVSVITGPLIRVVGERFGGHIKAAILYALNILFSKIPQFLRPFIPQLQRTFVKSLSDPTHEILRLRAAKALGTLIEYQPRVDPLVIELVTGTKQAANDGIKTAMSNALLEVIIKAGSKLNENSKAAIINLVEEEFFSSSDSLAVAYAKLIGSLSELLSVDEAKHILTDKVLNSSLTGDNARFAILTLNSFLKDAPSHIFNTDLRDQFVDFIIAAIQSNELYISRNGLMAAGKMLLLEGETKSPMSKILSEKSFEIGTSNIERLVNELGIQILENADHSPETRRLAIVIVRTLSRFKYEECIKPYYDVLGVSVFTCIRATIIPVKLAAEKAYLAMFRLVEEEDMSSFNEWFDKISKNGSNIETITGVPVQLRSIGDYTKRVGKRLGSVERERIAAGGDAEAMFSDRFEDEKEIWAIGDIELEKDI
ncbi:hypothetical protein TBLA_0F00410 [Henningerozyma blattae CBS 6284]|uniref:eIF-2-alpha kinase activator GCN1 n=1 Tax=Henningerozyma blattae (strain ATCC 34711 / CBS 6284 / DSM 70876 / NBRC 10599 / NRRL Y-10934 / UCD 77-7) TaxID=1071380 RepID=I2H5D3_HENB6|nr:hypothetical protein TBLA_0F00410 [Tetrapisispora blattae CBS 6284]CCH61585.1 hypothetical protein TBLA_0F00410 [Tetrapisispora blattae CBS 6284]